MQTPLRKSLRRFVMIYRWSLADRMLVDRVDYPLTMFVDVLDDDEFRPSGIDRIPGSYRNLLVAASPIRSAKIDLDGAVFHVRQLARDRHWQVEGIAIMPDSTLILADEGAGRRGRLAVYGFSGTVRP